MSGPLRVAVVGAGYFARYHIDAWQRLGQFAGAELIGVCDRDAAKLKGLGGAHFENAAEMLDALQPDVLDIATPPATHLELIGLVAERGIDAICQKPLATSYAQALELVRIAENAGIVLAVHENFRFMPWHRELKRLIDAGQLGRLHSIAMRLRPGDGQGPRAYLDRQPYFQQMERFLIHETAIHFIDTFRFLFGEISAVFARLRRLNPAIKGEDTGYVLFDFANGASGLFDGNRLNDHVADDTRLTMGEMWLEGDAGVLRLDGFARLWFKPHGGREHELAYVWPKRGFGGDCVYATQAHVLAHLRDGAPLANSARAYLRNLAIEEAVYRSAAEQRLVRL